MEVTYIPVVHYFECNTIAGRIIVSLLESQNIDFHVNPIIYPVEKNSGWEGNAFYSQLFFRNLWDGKYDTRLEKEISSMADIVLVSMNDFNYTYIVSKLLQAGKKVVIGGSTIQVRGYKATLDRLANFNDIKTISRNLIAVKGSVDLSTDLKSIIEKWQTTTITQNEFGTIYDCDTQTEHDPVNFVFKFHCPWMKCTFCNRLCLPVINFTKHVTAEKIYDNFKKVTNDKPVKIVDDYFLFTDKIIKVLEHCKSQQIEAQVGVKELTKQKYIENLNFHISKIKFGLEAMTDYSYTAFNKQQDYKMISDMTEALIRYGDPAKIHIQPFWIVDSPQENTSMVKQNYDRLMEFRQRFIDAGFLFSVYPSFMGLLPDDFLVEKYYGYEVAPDYMAGSSWVSRPKTGEAGLVRYDKKGSKMKSDIEIIDKSILETLFMDYLKYGT